MKLPPIHIPLGFRRPTPNEDPHILLTTTVMDLPGTNGLNPRVITQTELLVPETLPHLPESDTLLRSHLASAKRDDDLSVEDYRALMHRAFRRLQFLEWQHANPDDTEAYLKETEDRRFEFSNGLDIWEGYQNDPASWENATHYRPEVLPGR